MEFLRGKKTYIIAFLSALSGIGLAFGWIDEQMLITINAMLSRVGMIETDLRLPMTPLSPRHRAPLAELLKPFGLDPKP